MADRKCTNCGLTKPSDAFYESTPWACKPCHRQRAKSSRQTEIGQQLSRDYSKIRYAKFRTKYLARAKVRQALLKGILTKPNECSHCYQDRELYAHHEDYDRPLEVEWLCDACHKFRHAKLTDMSLIKP